MFEQLENLIRLQGLDREVQRLTQQLAGIAPQIEESRLHLAAAERALEEGKALVDAARKVRRAAEKELETQIEKRRKFQEQQSKVKTNKEYQALMGELASLKLEETAAEDRILAQMEKQAETEQLLPGLTAEVGREKLQFQQQEKVLRAAEEKLRQELAAAEAGRGAIVVTLEPATIQTYQRILKLRGSAVAEVRDEFCMGCSTKVTPQNFMEVMRNDRIHNCPHCQRILYYLKPEIRPAAPADPAAPAKPETAA
jgi:predicted  nucleic acid-binding Zn-ribbon protein